MLVRSGFAAHFSGNRVLFLLLDPGFLQPFLPLLVLPLVKAQSANAPSCTQQPLFCFAVSTPLQCTPKGVCAPLSWDIPGLKPSQVCHRGTGKHHVGPSESMGLVPKKPMDPALPYMFWEGFEPRTGFRKLPGMNWFHSQPILILDFHLKSHFHRDYMLDIIMICLASWASDFSLCC